MLRHVTDEPQPTDSMKEWVTAEELRLLDIVRPPECEQYSGHCLSETPIFEYDALEPDQIRLLRLHPGSKTDHMRCSLRTVSADDQLDYEAVSYCWGSPQSDQPCFIDCNGSRMAVTENLVDALWHFRFYDDDRILWVDAVCIDQGNPEERAQQVRMMDRIYSDAVRVLAFAGNERGLDEPTFKIIGTMREFLQRQNPDLDDDWMAIMGRYSELGYIEPMANVSLWISHLDLFRFVRETFNIKDHLDLCCFFSCRPYFNRCWVLQEIVLAKTVTIFFGSRRLPWDLFATSITILARSLSLIGLTQLQSTGAGCGSMHLTRLAYISDPEAWHSSRVAFFWQIINSFPLRSTFPVDRVYAYLGLAAPSIRTDIPVESLILPARLFHHVIVLFLRSVAEPTLHPLRKILSFLNYTPLHSSGELPSWVPDLSAFNLEEGLRQAHRTRWAAGGMDPAVELSPDGLSPSDSRELRIRGVSVWRILEICDEFVPIPTMAKDLQFMHPDIAGRVLSMRSLTMYDVRRLTDDGNDFRYFAKTERMREVRMRETTGRLAAMMRRARVGQRFCRRFEGEGSIESGDGVAAMKATWATLCASELAQYGGLTFLQEYGDLTFLQGLMASSPDLGVAENWDRGHPLVRGLSTEQCATLADIALKMGTEGWSGNWSDCSLAVADGGRLLRVPTRAEVEDSVYIFAGAATGHILRRVADGDERWSIIGAAFVQGAMRGELMPDEPLDEDYIVRIV